jgi:VWFA-related protein
MLSEDSVQMARPRLPVLCFRWIQVWAVLFGLAWLHSGAVTSTYQGSQQPVFTGQVNLIRLDVSVVDKQSQPVRGLTQADFTIGEDGRPQTIETFAVVDLPAGPSSFSNWSRDVVQDVATNTGVEVERLVVIVMDDGIADSRDLAATASAKEIGRNVVDALGPQDLAAVVYTGDDRNAQEFTHDRARLNAAVDRFKPGTVPGSSERTLQILAAIAKTLGSVRERRKSIIWVSSGIPYAIPEPGVPSRMDLLYYFWSLALTEARLANVNVYPVDPGGLKATSLDVTSKPDVEWERISAEQLTRLRDFLLATAANTGGHAFINSNEFKSKVTQIFRETGSFYLLGYVSTRPEADGKYRRIEVKVNRPGVTVHTRSGYYAPDPPDSKHPVLPPPPAAVAAVAGLVPLRDVPLDLATAVFPVAGRKEAAVALSLGLPPSPAGSTTMDVLFKAFTFEGDLRQTVTVQVPASSDPVHALARFDLAPGRYQARASATSAGRGPAGSVYIDFDVPDFLKAPVSLSGVVVSTVPSSPSVPADALPRFLPGVPTTRRVFRPADGALAFLQICQGGDKPPAPVTFAVRIVSDHNTVVSNSTETVTADRFGTARAADFRYVLPLATLGPGEYLLTFEAALGKTTARRDVRFTVK